MAIPLPIETERLTIRPFEPAADAAEMTAVYCDVEVMRYIPGGALADEAGVRELLERYSRWHAERGFSPWALVERATGRLVGDVGLGLFDTGDVELGYTLARAYWGRGYATEAGAACLAAALDHLAVPRIIAVVDAENEASLRVPERIGMARTERVVAYGRTHVVFSALRDAS